MTARIGVFVCDCKTQVSGQVDTERLATTAAELDGVAFADCYSARITTEIDGEVVQLISRHHLRMNKQASGRHKDLDDLEHLPED